MTAPGPSEPPAPTGAAGAPGPAGAPGDPTRGLPDTAGAPGGPTRGLPDTAGAPGGRSGRLSGGLPVATGAQIRAVALTVGRASPGLVAAAGVVLVAATAAALAVPRLLGELVDVVADGGTGGDVDRTVIALAVATLAQGALAGAGIGLTGALGERFLARVREQVVDRALAIPLADIERGGTGDLVGRVVGDVDTVSRAIRQALPEMLVSALLIGLTVVGLAALDWRLALAGLLAVPVQAWATRRYLRRSRPVYAAERAAEGRRTQQLHATVAGAPVVRALGLRPAHLRRLSARSHDAVDLAVETSRLRAWFHSGLNAAELVGLGAILVVGFLLVRDGAVTVGMATAAALYVHRLFDPIGIVLSQLDAAQAAVAALGRLVGVAALPLPPPPPAPAVPADASVELTDVRFGYDGGPDVLHGVTLRLAPGERVALVGASGAGKTTIAKLVAGVHATAAGSVRLGGVPVASIAHDVLDRHVTLVSQEVHVFAGPLAADLRLARPDATDAELAAALGLVGAVGWVEALPDGIDTVVGAGGHGLSATEAQQVALARLVLADPVVAVLDEATAEAGSAGARVLEAAASAAVAGRTSLVVAHRLTQAVVADRVVVLDGGRVVEDGTHASLLRSEGVYAELWAAWASARVGV